MLVPTSMERFNSRNQNRRLMSSPRTVDGGTVEERGDSAEMGWQGGGTDSGASGTGAGVGEKAGDLLKDRD